MDGFMDGWMDGLMSQLGHGCVGGQIDEWVGGLIGG